GGAAGVGAFDDGEALPAQPLGQQPGLGRFAGAVDAVQRIEEAGHIFLTTDNTTSFPGSAWERTLGEAPPRGRQSLPRQGAPRQSLGARSFLFSLSVLSV